MALKSLTRGLDLPDPAKKAPPASSEKTKSALKVAALVVCLLLTGLVVAYNLGYLSAKEGPPAKGAGGGDPGVSKTREELMAEQGRRPR